VHKRNILVFASLAGGGLVLLAIFITGADAFKNHRAETSKSWNREAIKAKYVGTQLNRRIRFIPRWFFPTIWRTTPIPIIA